MQSYCLKCVCVCVGVMGVEVCDVTGESCFYITQCVYNMMLQERAVFTLRNVSVL